MRKNFFILFFIGVVYLLSATLLGAQETAAPAPSPDLANESQSVSVQPAAADPDEKNPFVNAMPEPSNGKIKAETAGQPQSGKDKNVVEPVEVNGDHIEFIQGENKVIIDGNVLIKKGETELRCDHVEYFQSTKMAFATGNVVLEMPKGQIRGKRLAYNFGEMTGDFEDVVIVAPPYYGRTEKMAKVSPNKIEMKDGYITSCDLDKPHYKMRMKKVNIFPGKYLQAKNICMEVGKAPLAYIPRYTQNLKDKKPTVLYTPGSDKRWGMFLLTAWRWNLNENLKGVMHVDFRERRGVGGGFDTAYKAPHMGDGIFKMYYINERVTGKKRWYKEKTSPTQMKERFKYEWRHKWQIDKETQAIWQYYRYSDADFFKDYFWRDFQNDNQPTTYFLLTKNFNNGTFSFRTDKRVNRFVSTVERLPEIGYTIGSQQIGPSNIYLQSDNLFSHLSLPNAAPSDVRKKTVRFDTKNKFYYPTKVSFIELAPYVSQRETYYSRTQEPSRYNIIRSIFETGATLSTKFYRTFDVTGDLWGMQINKIRHIITPQVDYVYIHTPSFPSTYLDVFDSNIDSLTRGHKINFTLENRFQTKRDGKNVDLLRIIGKTDFLLKEDPGKGSFNTVTSDIEFRPVDWLTFYADTTYSAQESKLSTANFDMYINGGSKWQISLSRRLEVGAEDTFTTDFQYRINPKWRFRIYDRFDIGGGGQKEQGYTLTRDLHCWEMDINYNETRGMGSEIWIVFRLKAFPDSPIDLFGTSFNRRKTGSQSGP